MRSPLQYLQLKCPKLLCRHPLNCEPPLPMLMEKGFITPVSLHYVRNHGAVPKLDWDSHKVKVSCHTQFHDSSERYVDCEEQAGTFYSGYTCPQRP